MDRDPLKDPIVLNVLLTTHKAGARYAPAPHAQAAGYRVAVFEAEQAIRSWGASNRSKIAKLRQELGLSP